MATINEQVEEYRETEVLKLYKEHKDEIIRDLNREKSTKDDYNGRVILELLQNAVDQAIDGETVKIFISLENNELIIKNTGEPFDFEGVKSVMKSDHSPKAEDQNTIGYKGLGFRSVINWSHDISIYSHDLSIRFSNNFRKQYFEKNGILDETALLVAPQIIENIDQDGYDTIIKIKIDNETKIEEVKSQLNNINKYTLLFLDNVDELSIKIDNRTKRYQRKEKEDEVTIIDDGNENKFNLFKKEEEINDKKHKIVIAYDPAIDCTKNKLYSYFETNISLPIKWKCHVTFDLESNRKHIVESEDNINLFKTLISFILEKAQELAEKQNPRTYEFFDSVLPIIKAEHLSFGINDASLISFFKDEIENAKILPTLPNGLVCLNDRPIFYENIPDFFKDIENEKILCESNDKDRNEILSKMLQYNDFNPMGLKEQINKVSHEYDAKTNVGIYLWWEGKYRNNNNCLPNVLKNSHGEFIEKDTNVYFVHSNEDFDIPTWAKIIQLDKEYEQELKEQTQKFFPHIFKKNKDSVERIIGANSGKYQILSHINFHDSDISNIISPINSSVKNDFKKAKEFVKWLWKHYSNRDGWVPPDEIRFNFPSNNETVCKANELFLGQNYDNPLGDKLFQDNKFEPLLDFKRLNIEQEQKEDFIKFILKFSVNKFPVLQKTTIEDSDFRKQYSEEWIKNKILEIYEKDEPRYIELKKVETNNIEKLETILDNLEDYEIFQWLCFDDKIKQEIELKNKNQITVDYDIRSYTHRNNQIIEDDERSYIKYIISKTKWINIGGVKHAPVECVFINKYDVKLNELLHVIDEEYIKNICNKANITKDTLNKTIKHIGIAERISNLKSNDLYDFLLKLPNYDKRGIISKKLYNEFCEPDNTIDITYSENKQRFFQEGQVYTYNRDGESFHLASDTYFTNSMMINLKNKYIIFTPNRKGSFETFKNVFGVQKFEENVSVVEGSETISQHNKSFQEDFKDFVKYARHWKIKNEKLGEEIDKITVKLITQISLEENGKTMIFKDKYIPIFNGKTWYIVVDDSDDVNDLNIRECIENICGKIGNTENETILRELGEVYENKNNRLQRTEKYLGEPISIEDTVIENEIRKSFAKILNLKYEDDDLKGIDFDNIESLEVAESIFKLLKRHNKSIKELRRDNFKYIDKIKFENYFQNMIKNFIDTNEDKYKNSLFVSYKDKDRKDQEQFLDKVDEFKHFSPDFDATKFDIDFDAQKLVTKHFSIIGDEIDAEADEEYENNFKEYFSDLYNNDEFKDFLIRNKNYKSLIYFINDTSGDIVDEIKNKYNGQKQLSLEDIYPSISGEQNRAIDDFIVTKSKFEPNITSTNKGANSKEHVKTSNEIERENRKKRKSGKQAEEIVYNSLKDRIPSLKWTSESSSCASQRGNSQKYDMEYIKDGEKHYIEVKAGVTSFYMSRSEYDFSQENKDVYEIYLVDSDATKIDGPHTIGEFEGAKEVNEYIFNFKKVTDN